MSRSLLQSMQASGVVIRLITLLIEVDDLLTLIGAVIGSVLQKIVLIQIKSSGEEVVEKDELSYPLEEYKEAVAQQLKSSISECVRQTSDADIR